MFEVESLIKAYLQEFGGNYYGYRQWTEYGHQRPGQAFFNALSHQDQSRLRGSIRDPFYMDKISEVENVIEWLIYN